MVRAHISLFLFLVRIKHQARFVKLNMAPLNSLHHYPNTLDYKCAVDKTWFMSPSLRTKHMVKSTIIDTISYTNDVNYKCIVFLQEIEILKADPPSCWKCNQNYSPLLESTIKRKEKRGREKLETKVPKTSFYFRASQKNK